MKRISEVLMVTAFLGFLVLAMAATVLREPETVSFFENRTLAVFPEYSAQAIGDGSYAVQLERYLDDHAAFRTTLLKVKTKLDLALRRPVVNDVVITEERLLPYLSHKTVYPTVIAAQAESMANNLKRISDTVTEYGGYYCYVAVPCQYAYFADEYPWYLYNGSNLTPLVISSLSQALAERGVEFLDVGAVYEQMGHPDGFSSRADNHYTIYGAFTAYQRVLEKVAAETGLDFPILGEDDVAFDILPSPYMGSRERMLLNLERREEQLSVLYPVEGIPFTRIDNGVEVEPSVYALPSSEPSLLTYSLYMGGDIAQTLIDTHREELPSVLVYGNSFTNAMECILYLSFDKMYSLDLRHYQDMSLEDYIREIRPEVVICIRDYDSLLNPADNGGAP